MVPWKGFIAEEESVNINGAPAFINAINNNCKQSDEEDYPIEPTHSNILVKI
jgi:hypothetical protein